MDAEDTVLDTVSALRDYMKSYTIKKGDWVAPYTSIVTSSMMGKSRHMKEVANHLPSVYICLRNDNRSYGYPHRSPGIVEWLSTGAAGILKQPVSEYYFCFSTLKWSAFILSTIRILTGWISNGEFFESLGMSNRTDEMFEFRWFWQFFGEPPDKSKLVKFWSEVQEATALMLRQHPSGLAAHSYFQKRHVDDVKIAFRELWKCFGNEHMDPQLPLILIFDEARTLCDHEAYNGVRIYEEHTINFREPVTFPKPAHAQPTPFRSFSNFYALRRALRYFSATTKDIPQIFAVFTDTTSRITNFQPTSSTDPSMRVPSLPEVGKKQFPPIFVFSSVDVYSRVLNKPMCVSNPDEIADPERLLKFGRAGWYATYSHGNASHKAERNSTNAVLNMATSKLICAPYNLEVNPFLAPFPLSPSNLIKLLAIIAPRLALTIGAYTLESSELIASHLAILTRTDDERHFFRMVYPSEPLVAEVSAQLTHDNGWGHPLSALVHYVKGGIVCAGFKGELVTKIVCLMAMDKALSSIDTPEDQWTFSRPVLVSQFLNHLIVPLHNHSTFCEGLHGVRDPDHVIGGTLNVDDKKLQSFLGGYVFFNHFIRVEVNLSYPMLVHAWNRGAAIMCMTNTKGIDYVIPVMLHAKSNVTFGPLHGPWTEEHIQEARKYLSCIFINSKLYASSGAQIKAAWGAAFSAKSFKDYDDGRTGQLSAEDIFRDTDSEEDETMSEDLNVDSQYEWQEDDDPHVETKLQQEMKDLETERLEMNNVYMSLIQDFGKKRRNESWITVGSVLATYNRPHVAQPHLTRPPLKSQFIVVLKGIGTDTYQCLKGNLQERSRRYLKELTTAKVDYVDKRDKSQAVVGMQNIPLVYGESMLWSQKWVQRRPSLENGWNVEHRAHSMAQESPTTGTEAIGESMDEVEHTSTI
jgi:hypothetical protein